MEPDPEAARYKVPQMSENNKEWGCVALGMPQFGSKLWSGPEPSVNWTQSPVPGLGVGPNLVNPSRPSPNLQTMRLVCSCQQ